MTIEKLNTNSSDLTKQNIARLAELFLECMTEGAEGTASDRGEPVVDFDLLRQALADHLVEGPQERYRLDWPGKRQALLTANAPIDKTLRPMREDSVDFDTTRNLFIEGDNLDALKLLQETYLGKVKMIYIDPPYNTGKDFIYKDNFAQSRDRYEAESGQRDEGGRLIANPETNGRFHSDWLSMIYPRLKLARNLLRDDGLIFVSIDANELCNLTRVMEELFGERCYRGTITRATGTPTGGGNRALVGEVDYILIFGRNPNIELLGVGFTDADASIYDKADEKGRYLTRTLRRTGGEDRREDRPTMYYPIKAPDGSQVFPVGPTGYESRWICGLARFEELKDAGLIEFINRGTTEQPEWQVHQKFYLEGRAKQPSDFWSNIEGNKKATRDLRALFGGEKVFDNPKPVGLLERMLEISGLEEGDTVLDFFAGSGAFFHAVLRYGARQGINTRCVTVQLPQEIDGDDPISAAARMICDELGKAPTIAEITKERMRRACVEGLDDKLSAESELDGGFRAFRIDSGNFANTRFTPQQASQEALAGMISHIKEDRTDEDLLFGALLRWGVDITLPVEKRELADRTIWLVDPALGGDEGAALIACFARPHQGKGGIDTELADAIARMKPLRVLFRDDGFVSDSTMENVQNRFRQLAPDTDVKVL
jgi:adenine-specific DNA-methyltransferase